MSGANVESGPAAPESGAGHARDPRLAAKRLLRAVEYAAPGGEITGAFLALEQDLTNLIAERDRLAAAAADLERAGWERARRECAEEALRWAENYPESVFPADSDSRDAIAGTALRTVLPRLAERLASPVTEETPEEETT